MLPVDKLNMPGEHFFTFEGGAGTLEAVLTVPSLITHSYIALLGHPHSLQGGTMNNKVVTTLARAFKELNIPSLRFNFRGVGHSQGAYDNGLGESEDMLALAALWNAARPHSQCLFAGFSFGSYVAYRAAALHPSSLLITIAPPVHHYDYQEFSPSPWHIIHGCQDEVVPLALIKAFIADHSTPPAITYFEDTTHFFHGKLLMLKECIMTIVNEQVLQK